MNAEQGAKLSTVPSRVALGRVLVVEDQEGIRTQLRWGLSDQFEVVVAASRDAARQALGTSRFDTATLGLGLPPDPDGPTEGLRLLEEFLTVDPAMKVIVLTGNGDHQNALHAVQRGAFDYYLKPVNLEELRLILERACRLSRLDREAFGDVTMPAASSENVEILGG